MWLEQQPVLNTESIEGRTSKNAPSFQRYPKAAIGFVIASGSSIQSFKEIFNQILVMPKVILPFSGLCMTRAITEQGKGSAALWEFCMHVRLRQTSKKPFMRTNPPALLRERGFGRHSTTIPEKKAWQYSSRKGRKCDPATPSAKLPKGASRMVSVCLPGQTPPTILNRFEVRSGVALLHFLHALKLVAKHLSTQTWQRLDLHLSARPWLTVR